MMKKELLENLRSLLGEDKVLTDDSSRKQKAQDLSALRLFQKHVGWEPILPFAVVEPDTTAAVVKTLKFCNDNDITVIPYGGGSGVLSGAEVVEQDTLVIDVSKLNKIIDMNEENLTVSCEAGVYLHELESFVNEKGYVLGHYPQSIDLAQMGGLVATRSTGQFSTKYGGIEDLVLGLEAVLPNGEIIEIKSSPRRAVGPDLRHLLLGSEGIIGIITKVTVKIFPEPEERWKQAYRVPTMRQGLEIIRQIMRKDVKPAVVRLHDWLECEKPYGSFMEEGECLLIFLSEGTKELCEYEGAVVDRIAQENQAIPAGSKPVDIWFKHRNDAADEYEEYGVMGFLVDTIEISSLWENIADIYEETVERVYYEVPETVFFSGHSSHSYIHGTNIYFQMGAVPKPDLDDAERVHRAIWDIIMEVTLKYGGSIGHHHGVGKHRTKYMKDELASSYILMEGIKKCFDPKGIMNPGVILE